MSGTCLGKDGRHLRCSLASNGNKTLKRVCPVGKWLLDGRASSGGRIRIYMDLSKEQRRSNGGENIILHPEYTNVQLRGRETMPEQ